MKAAEKGVGMGSPYAKGCEGSGKRKGAQVLGDGVLDWEMA